MNDVQDQPVGQTSAQSERLPLLPKQKKFLIPIIILLAITLVGLAVGIAIGFVSVKRGEAYKTTVNELEKNKLIEELVGTPFETGLIAFGQHDERNGTYDLTFTIAGPKADAAVRSRCERETDTGPWQVTYLDVGVGGRDGQIYTLVGDPENMPSK